ncbi:NAD-dependent epimerase/dehydratase family protein [Sulfurisphaera javensis]|uniref:NAD-dependent epimerase/dehydratase family protein n=1 Tax=Sulfurisphaera javensis TaxID=2049879 RepID=A0AAT9GNA5_9CREN
MRIFITSLGFIATHVAEILSSSNEVILTYRNLNPVKKLYKEILEEKGVKLIKLDILTERDKLKEEIKKSDVIINFIGEISGDERTLYIANVEIPKIIAMTIKEVNNKALFIHTSGSTYGITGEVKIEKELGEGFNPQTPFEITKLQGEKEVYSIAKGNFPLVILRPTLVYGKYAAHIQFVIMYRLVKMGIIPKTGISFMPISANYIGKMILELIKEKPELLYFYATECEPVSLDSFFEIYSKALGKKTIKIPIPKGIVKSALPKEIRSLIRYEGTKYDCSIAKKLLNDLKFNENEVYQNALFLKELDKKKILIPT